MRYACAPYLVGMVFQPLEFWYFHFRTKIAEQIVTGNFWNMVIIIFLDAYCILGIFALLNFHENGDFNNFAENIFANDPCGQHKRCGTAILSRNLILRLSKIRKIHENKVT